MSLRKDISKYVTYVEATKSNTATKLGIDNTPTDIQLERMNYVAENLFDCVREHFGKPLGITSFFRSEKLNVKIGGSRTSQHVLGEAIDIDADIYGGLTNKEIFDYIHDNLEYGQLIWEFGTSIEPAWVHVSLSRSGNKKEALIAYKEANWDGRSITKYKPYVKR